MGLSIYLENSRDKFHVFLQLLLHVCKAQEKEAVNLIFLLPNQVTQFLPLELDVSSAF